MRWFGRIGAAAVVAASAVVVCGCHSRATADHATPVEDASASVDSRVSAEGDRVESAANAVDASPDSVGLPTPDAAAAPVPDPHAAAFVAAGAGYAVLWSAMVDLKTAQVWFTRFGANGERLGPDVLLHSEVYDPNVRGVSALDVTPAESPEGFGAIWFSYGPQKGGGNDTPTFARVKAGSPPAVTGRCIVLGPPFEIAARPGLLGATWSAAHQKYAVVVAGKRLDVNRWEYQPTLRTFAADECTTLATP